MNDDPRFDRVRIRRAATALAEAACPPAGSPRPPSISPGPARRWKQATEAVLLRACRLPAGPMAKAAILLDPIALAAAPRELALRALASLLMRVGGQAYRPRFDALERLFARLADGTLKGATCMVAELPRRGQRNGFSDRKP